ncbi:MAG TPA: hypothetical protein DEH02_15735 [Bacteroidales bacterium]|nr:MAG: hypothetical protein A2X01_08835 [Bacteroidetes bacterium GWF2_35_48]OFY97463.1 MAG: hypothetical protein A2491_04460 [Bacteroidetes bacterium RIFOXYC12_FULL_35_7]HBX52514.1 hypothetical protein [Bacteroidales bacterium]
MGFCFILFVSTELCSRLVLMENVSLFVRKIIKRITVVRQKFIILVKLVTARRFDDKALLSMELPYLLILFLV